MDVRLLLSLPVDIRKLVYYHLNGQFTSVGPPPVENLYCSNTVQVAIHEPRTKIQDLIYEKFYHIFAPYINIFEYSPALINKWLEYSLWLRYDCVVLDCLRLNHIYGGTLIGKLDWLVLDGKLRMSFFSNHMLQLWYTFREYSRWVASKDASAMIEYLRINLEYMSPASLNEMLVLLARSDLFDFVNCILFDDNNENEASFTVNQEYEEVTHQITDSRVVKLIKNMEPMRFLKDITVRGVSFYEGIVNFHGVRDNPGKTINYIVRNRIMVVKLTQIHDLGLCDLNRWENLRELKLSHVQEIDLNKLLLPKKCRILGIRKARILRWWNIVEDNNLMHLFKVDAFVKQFTKIRRVDAALIDDPAEIGKLKSLATTAMGSLNFIKLQDIEQIEGGKIIVPGNLYNSRRILLLGSTMQSIKEITVL